MRKTFPFADPPHKPPQVVAAIKSKVRKYLKRERRKALPDGVHFWDFDCRVGQDGPTKVVHVAALIGVIDEAAASDWTTIHIEILAKPGIRRKKERPATEEPSDSTDASDA